MTGARRRAGHAESNGSGQRGQPRRATEAGGRGVVGRGWRPSRAAESGDRAVQAGAGAGVSGQARRRRQRTPWHRRRHVRLGRRHLRRAAGRVRAAEAGGLAHACMSVRTLPSSFSATTWRRDSRMDDALSFRIPSTIWSFSCTSAAVCRFLAEVVNGKSRLS